MKQEMIIKKFQAFGKCQPKWIFFILTFLLFCGCYQATDEDDLRTVPVTNNPNITPQHRSFSGFSPSNVPY